MFEVHPLKIALEWFASLLVITWLKSTVRKGDFNGMKLICNEMYRNTTRTTDTSGMPRDLTMFLQGVVAPVEYLDLEDGWSL